MTDSTDDVDCYDDSGPDYACTGCVKLRAQLAVVKVALEESLKLQSHYARLLNQYDGGARIGFKNAKAWMRRLKQIQEAP